MMYKIPSWIARNLENYGNSIIPSKLLKSYTEEALIKYYEVMFNCNFRIVCVEIEGTYNPETYIIEKVKEVEYDA